MLASEKLLGWHSLPMLLLLLIGKKEYVEEARGNTSPTTEDLEKTEFHRIVLVSLGKEKKNEI